MNEFTENYISAGYSGYFLKPKVEKLAEIWFEITDDVLGSLQKWEKLGFIKLDLKSDNVGEIAAERSEFAKFAATVGASLVIYKPWPSLPEPVYLAPKSAAARNLAQFEPKTGILKLVMPRLSRLPSTQIGPIAYNTVRLQEGITQDLPALVAHWQEKGFVLLGTSDVVVKNNNMEAFDRLHISAIAVGASLMFSQITPAKARSIRRKASGHIDMDAVLSDMPSKVSPKGNSVIQAAFLAPMSFQAQDLAELEEQTTVIYVRSNSEQEDIYRFGSTSA
ncbi:hypothetical protein GJ698_26720 [Pseudoduganella sp. FT26W]|uniref:Uncharacterized protein n=1 Tax=Duganella aquatilis TaxID=2666082 RepID=A0A844DG61_9BURK|nr:hypothetical protein [Duganella aquatilis]MRW87670.1 hypothetical protein [Duganella aquatilis]